MSLPAYYYVLGTPLGILGLVRWACWLIRRIPAVLYKPITGDHRMSMTIVVPVYQEDPAVFAAAIESWLSNDVEDIVLVIDVSDQTCQQIAARYPVRVLVTDVPGKRDALRRGWNAARTDLVALVDSDTVWASDVAREVCKPFADPRIGGVGTRQSVYGSKGFLSRITDMFLDHRYFDENASQSLLGQAVSCLSGRTAVYRRQLLMDLERDFMNETFWGVPCLSGDDKRLTTLLLERGHLTYMQRTAEVWSTFPNTWRIFFKQRLRWARNTWRSDLRALSRRWVWRRKFLAYTMVDKAVSSFTLLFGPAFLVYSMIVQNWVFVGVLVGWWQISRSAKLLPHLRMRPSSFFFILPYVAVSWLMALIKIQALLTIRKQRWLTRQVAVKDGAVVRTGEPTPTGAPAGTPVEATVPVPRSTSAPRPVPQPWSAPSPRPVPTGRRPVPAAQHPAPAAQHPVPAPRHPMPAQQPAAAAQHAVPRPRPFPATQHPQPSHPLPSHPQPSHPQPSHPQPSHPQQSHSEPSHPQQSHPQPRLRTPSAISRAHRPGTPVPWRRDTQVPNGQPSRPARPAGVPTAAAARLAALTGRDAHELDPDPATQGGS